jgi:hypothetical protein
VTKSSTIAHLKGIQKLKPNDHTFISSELTDIFDIMVTLLSKAKDDMRAIVEDGFRYELWTSREIVIKGKRRKGIMFASLVQFENYVGFYFQPMYMIPSMTEELPHELESLRKGATSFHIQTLTRMQLHLFRLLIDQGKEKFHAKGWA